MGHSSDARIFCGYKTTPENQQIALDVGCSTMSEQFKGTGQINNVGIMNAWKLLNRFYVYHDMDV